MSRSFHVVPAIVCAAPAVPLAAFASVLKQAWRKIIAPRVGSRLA